MSEVNRLKPSERMKIPRQQSAEQQVTELSGFFREVSLGFDGDRAVIEAVGQKPNPIIQSTTSGLETGKRGTFNANEAQRTSREGIFAGVDVIDYLKC